MLVLAIVRSVNRRLRASKLLAAAVLMVTLLACTQEGSTSTTTAGASTTSTSLPAPTTTIPTTTTTVPPPVVAVDGEQEGFTAPLWDDDGYSSPEFAETIAEIADTGAEWVTLVPTWYQTSPESSLVYPERPGRTATDESLGTAIGLARDLGLQVMLKPHVDLTEGGNRGEIEPTEADAWWASYREMILGYAALAESSGVDQFSVGTELAGVSGDQERWRDLIEEVRGVFSGGVTYAANHDEFESVRFWDALDFVGIDAYFPLADEPTSDAEALTASWEEIVARVEEVAVAVDRPVVFTEVGYPSQEGAVTAPFNPHVSDVESEDEQEAALVAMLDATGDEPWFGGFHWWMWFEESSDEAQALGYTPEGKATEVVLRQRWETGS